MREARGEAGHALMRKGVVEGALRPRLHSDCTGRMESNSIILTGIVVPKFIGTGR